MTISYASAELGGGQVNFIESPNRVPEARNKMTKADYERLLLANEQELWSLTERHDKLVHCVQEKLWPRACMSMAADLRAEFADELYDYGCEVEA